MPRRPHHLAAAYTDATLRLRHEHRKTICRTSRSERSPDNRTARRSATLPEQALRALALAFPFSHRHILRVVILSFSVRRGTYNRNDLSEILIDRALCTVYKFRHSSYCEFVPRPLSHRLRPNGSRG